MCGERRSDSSAGFAYTGDDRDPSANVLEGEFQQRFALFNYQTDGLASMSRNCQTLGTVVQMEIEQLAVAVEVNAPIRERGEGA
jgi:hypothetical protein